MEHSKALSFVTLMLIIAVSSLLLRIAIERIIKINIAQNESNANNTLKLIAAALENYAKDHTGNYPISLSVLTKENPSYLDKDYIADSPLRGYDYNCLRLDVSGYSCSAIPARCNMTGKKIYTITTGSLFISEECNKKE